MSTTKERPLTWETLEWHLENNTSSVSNMKAKVKIDESKLHCQIDMKDFLNEYCNSILNNELVKPLTEDQFNDDIKGLIADKLFQVLKDYGDTITYNLE